MPDLKPKPVDREAVRVLALNVGVREAARQLGLNEDRVRNWSSRFNWFGVSPPHKTGDTIDTKAPGDAMLATLNEHKNATRMSLARSVRKLAREAEKAPLSKSGRVLDVARTAGATFEDWQPKQSSGANVMVNIALLGVDPGQIGA